MQGNLIALLDFPALCNKKKRQEFLPWSLRSCLYPLAYVFEHYVLKWQFLVRHKIFQKSNNLQEWSLFLGMEWYLVEELLITRILQNNSKFQKIIGTYIMLWRNEYSVNNFTNTNLEDSTFSHNQNQRNSRTLCNKKRRKNSYHGAFRAVCFGLSMSLSTMS